MQGIRSKLTYSNVVATICLFFILGTSGAWAAKKLINGSKIKPHTITGKQVKNGSLTTAVFKGGLPAGATGVQGPTGPSGATGATGTLAPTQFAQVVNFLVGQSCSTTLGIYCGSGVGNGWGTPTDRPAAAYFVDSAGFVHLQGSVRRVGTVGSSAFSLPISLAPRGLTDGQSLRFITNQSGAFPVDVVVVTSSGTPRVEISQPGLVCDGCTFALNGVTWGT